MPGSSMPARPADHAMIANPFFNNEKQFGFSTEHHQQMQFDLSGCQPAMSNMDYYSGAAIPGRGMPLPIDPLSLDTSLTDSFNYPVSYDGGMPFVPEMHDTHSWSTDMNYTPVSASSTSTYMTGDSMSSTFSSSPIIKSEEQSPSHPFQSFYDTAPSYSSLQLGQPSSGSSEDVDGINHSTDIDVLMRAIQSKAGESEHQAREVCCPCLQHLFRR